MPLEWVERAGASRGKAAPRPSSTGLGAAGVVLCGLLLLWAGLLTGAAAGVSAAVEAVALVAIAGALAALLIGEFRRRQTAQASSDNDGRRGYLAGHSFDLIVCFDAQTAKRTYVSPACRRIYGYEPEELLPLSSEEIVHPEDHARVMAAMQRLETEPAQPPIRYRGRRKDGSYVWVEASLTRSRHPATGADEIVSIVRDIGDRIRHETALLQAKEAADSANRSKSQFLATMSHELRTPLNAIIGFAELMENQVMGPIGNDHYRSYISDIHLSGSHLLQLINDILDLTKAEAGMLELNEDVVDIAASIGAVARLTKAPIDKAGLTLALDLPRDLPPVRADERKVRQVFFNLIGNSVKFTPSGGQISVHGEVDAAAGLSVTVADTGIGIADDDIERVMQPFVQVDSSFARQHHGTGLGLPAVKAIMELHGGKIALRSRLGKGTEATIIFPPERILPTGAAAAARSAA
jgi:PAS domain S-box-containing protein